MNKEQELRDAVVAVARLFPRETPAPGGAATVHQFAIDAGTVWALDKALRQLDDAIAEGRRSSDEQAEVVGAADKLVSEIEQRFPNWKAFRDLVDCIDCTLHALRGRAPAVTAGGVTEAMVTRAMDRAGWTTKPTPPEYETCNGALIDLGISQDEADHINAQLREEMREILLAALAVGDEGIREGERLALLVEELAGREKPGRSKLMLMIAARAVRRGRLLTPAEQLENVERFLTEGEDADAVPSK